MLKKEREDLVSARNALEVLLLGASAERKKETSEKSTEKKKKTAAAAETSSAASVAVFANQSQEDDNAEHDEPSSKEQLRARAQMNERIDALSLDIKSQTSLVNRLSSIVTAMKGKGFDMNKQTEDLKRAGEQLRRLLEEYNRLTAQRKAEELQRKEQNRARVKEREKARSADYDALAESFGQLNAALNKSELDEMACKFINSVYTPNAVDMKLLSSMAITDRFQSPKPSAGPPVFGCENLREGELLHTAPLSNKILMRYSQARGKSEPPPHKPLYVLWGAMDETGESTKAAEALFQLCMQFSSAVFSSESLFPFRELAASFVKEAYLIHKESVEVLRKDMERVFEGKMQATSHKAEFKHLVDQKRRAATSEQLREIDAKRSEYQKDRNLVRKADENLIIERMASLPHLDFTRALLRCNSYSMSIVRDVLAILVDKQILMARSYQRSIKMRSTGKKRNHRVTEEYFELNYDTLAASLLACQKSIAQRKPAEFQPGTALEYEEALDELERANATAACSSSSSSSSAAAGAKPAISEKAARRLGLLARAHPLGFSKDDEKTFDLLCEKAREVAELHAPFLACLPYLKSRL
jgi:hypothetical protein